MAKNDKSVVVKISGDSDALKKEFDKIKKQTKGLEDGLKSVAKRSAVTFTALTAAVVGTTAAFRKQEQAQIRTVRTIEATGNAAGLTADEIFKMATSLQDVTTFGDEAIIAGQNLLLTFKNIGRDVFPRATEAILDMSTAMDVGLKEASIQLGKALNDPVLGISALTRVGIQFTEEQKSLIRSFVETGNVAAAQGVILTELESQFGGVSRAAAQGTGKLIQLNNIIGDIFENIGKNVFTILEPFIIKLTELAKAVRDNEAFAKLAANIITYGSAAAGVLGITATLGLAIISLRRVVLLATVAVTAFGVAASTAWAKATLGLSLIITGVISLINQVGSLQNAIRLIEASFTFFSNQAKIGLNKVKIAVSELIANTKDLQAALLEATPGNAFSQTIAQLRRDADNYRGVSEDIIAENQRLNKSFKEIITEIPIAQKLEKNESEFQEELAQREEQELVKLEQEAAFRERRDEIDAELKEVKLALELEENELERIRLEERLTELQRIRDEFLSQEEKKKAQTQDRIEKSERRHKKALEKIEKRAVDAKMQADLQVLDSSIKLGESLVKEGTAASKALFLARQAFAIAEVLINGQRGAAQARAVLAPFGEPVAAQIQIASGINAAVIAAQTVAGFSGAQDGAVVGGLNGTRAGGDRRPFMLEDGELIVPRRNFDEVVEAVAISRGFTNDSASESNVNVMLDLTDNASKFITAQQFENNQLGTDRR